MPKLKGYIVAIILAGAAILLILLYVYAPLPSRPITYIVSEYGNQKYAVEGSIKPRPARRGITSNIRLVATDRATGEPVRDSVLNVQVTQPDSGNLILGNAPDILFFANLIPDSEGAVEFPVRFDYLGGQLHNINIIVAPKENRLGEPSGFIQVQFYTLF